MDRLIALLAALVGLIALGGALLVHNSADAAVQRQATEIAQLKASLTLLNQQSPGATTAPAPAQVAASTPPADDGTAEALLALQTRIASLEQTTREQAAALDSARTALANLPITAAPVTDVAAVQQPAQSATPAALSSDGPTTDCIPLGTRFMAGAGDDFPICKTKAVIKIAAVNDGEAIVEGPGSVVVGSSGQLTVPGCTVAVLSADTSGYAEMRVTCI